MVILRRDKKGFFLEIIVRRVNREFPKFALYPVLLIITSHCPSVGGGAFTEGKIAPL